MAIAFAYLIASIPMTAFIWPRRYLHHKLWRQHQQGMRVKALLQCLLQARVKFMRPDINEQSAETMMTPLTTALRH